MADITLGAESALSKRDDETSQQFGDRLLAAHRLNQRTIAAGSADRTPLDRSKLGDQIDDAALASEYSFVLCHAIMDRLEKLQGLHGPKGVHANTNTKAHLDIAVTLASLQLDKLIEGKAAISGLATLTTSHGAV